MGNQSLLFIETNMQSHTLSIVLATRNEEKNLLQCLESVKSIADEIIIADESSTDKTVEIAKNFNAKVIRTKHQINFHITKNIAIDHATCEWTLQLDADEQVSPDLAREIKEVINSNPPQNGFWLNRRNWFLSGFLKKGGQYPDPTLRLYKTGFGRLPARDVHEQAIVQGKVGHLQYDLLHYRDRTFKKYLSGFSRYSSLIAHQLKTGDKPKNTLTPVKYLLISPVYTLSLIHI